MTQDAEFHCRCGVTEFQEQLRSGRHDVHQLRMRLQLLPDDVRFDALLGIFAENKDADTYTDQEIAGRLLLELMPECRHPLDQILNSIAATWNVSVEQLPLFLATTFGREMVIATANSLSQTWSKKDPRSKALDTIVWWLDSRRAERRSEIRTNNPMNPNDGTKAS